MAPVTAARVDIHPHTVQRQFDARAPRHAAHDALVREVSTRMVERLSYLRHPVQRLLDLGCGSGDSRAALQSQFPQAQWLGVDLSPARLHADGAKSSWSQRLRGLLARGKSTALRVCANADALPFADGSLDMVFCNLMLHWHPAPHAVVAEIARVLRSGGLLFFSSYGPDTLLQLRQACAQALPAALPMPYVDMHDYGDMLVAAGFEAPVMEVENLDLRYPSASALLAEVRALGGNPRADRAQGLPGGRQARALHAALAAQTGADGRIGLRFEIVVGHGWKAAPRPPAGMGTIALPAPYRRQAGRG